MKTLTVYESKDGRRFDTAEACDKHDRKAERIKQALTTQSWRICCRETPPEAEDVLTKIHDEKGERNQVILKKRGRLWFFSDDSMYVYYTPTHWMPLPA